MYRHGLVIGKFYPFHKGHEYLISEAMKVCEDLTVLVCYNTVKENISGTNRANWIRETFGAAISVKVIFDIDKDDDSIAWAEHTKTIFNEMKWFLPDVFISSESYGFPFSEAMGIPHVLVDIDRNTFPISGTMVRENPTKYYHMLPTATQHYYSQKMVVLGAESTGTSTLAKALSEHYNVACVPEFGRYFVENLPMRVEDYVWSRNDFVNIARMQEMWIESYIPMNRMLVCDTDSFATVLWHERYMGGWDRSIDMTEGERIYILTADDIPFVQDGTRDGEHIRHDMHLNFINKLRDCRKTFIVVSGSHEERMKAAIKFIESKILS